MNIRLVTLHLLGNFSVARGGGEGGAGSLGGSWWPGTATNIYICIMFKKHCKFQMISGSNHVPLKWESVNSLKYKVLVVISLTQKMKNALTIKRLALWPKNLIIMKVGEIVL